MNKLLEIGGKKIGQGKPCFIIAEAGVNHNRDLGLALKLVDTAAISGADAVKFQTFTGEDLVIKTGKMASYQKRNIGVEMTQRQMLEGLALPEDFYGPIIKQCRKRNILFLSTPHGGRKSVEFLESLDVKAYKIGSGDLTNYLLLKTVAVTRKPVILSSGMATMSEVKDAIKFVKSCGNKQIAILHATTNYPCPPEEVNLRALKSMMDELDIPVGYSDHTQGVQVAVMAACLGMAIYESHFTMDKTLPGPDHIASADPEELKKRIEFIRLVPIILGQAKKGPTRSEVKSMLTLVRKSLVAAGDLETGHRLTALDLEAKRPGDGISPVHFKKFISKKLRHSLKKDTQINFEDIE